MADNDALHNDILDNAAHPGTYGDTLAQHYAARVLGTVGIAVSKAQLVYLTDAQTWNTAASVVLNPGQVEAAVAEYRQVTGEDNIDADTLVSSLPWEDQLG